MKKEYEVVGILFKLYVEGQFEQEFTLIRAFEVLAVMKGFNWSKLPKKGTLRRYLIQDQRVSYIGNGRYCFGS